MIVGERILEVSGNKIPKTSIKGLNINISLEGTISAHGFFLLERTDDATVANIDADQIYAGGLNNNGENL